MFPILMLQYEQEAQIFTLKKELHKRAKPYSMTTVVLLTEQMC